MSIKTKTQTRSRNVAREATFLAVLITLTFWLAGCQVDAGGSFKAFYPDKMGGLGEAGDPRKGQYAPERVDGFGSWADFKGRPGEKPIGGVQ